jgi:hypothetical protein
VEKGTALTFKSGWGGEGNVEYKEGGPATTAAFNRALESFVIVSKTDTSGGGGDAGKRAVGMMLEWMHG